ncbi:MAG: macro domain-containing protein [Planctomycetota bacterium]
MMDYTTGDATAPVGDGKKIIAHICNDVGGWGKGFVVAISKRWADPENEYRRWFAERESNDFGLGGVQMVSVEDDLWVANMVAQEGLGKRKGVPPIRYKAVEACLANVAVNADEIGASVHMPRIGCGLAGGKWEEIEAIIERTLLARGLRVVVYDFE